MTTYEMSRGKRVLRVIAGVLLVLTGVRVWVGPDAWSARAQAQIPNAGTQRADLLSEVSRTNQLLQEVLDTLRTKTIKVEVQDAGERAGKGARTGMIPPGEKR